jgi:hypothetical protein
VLLGQGAGHVGARTATHGEALSERSLASRIILDDDAVTAYSQPLLHPLARLAVPEVVLGRLAKHVVADVGQEVRTRLPREHLLAQRAVAALDTFGNFHQALKDRATQSRLAHDPEPFWRHRKATAQFQGGSLGDVVDDAATISAPTF